MTELFIVGLLLGVMIGLGAASLLDYWMTRP